MRPKITIAQASSFISWWREEVFTGKKTAAIYNELSQKQRYEMTVDFPARVARLQKVFQVLPFQPKTVLDLAAGTGAAIAAMPWVKTAKIVGIDISSGMLGVARQRFKNYSNITFKKANFLHLDFKPGSFDLITMTYASRFVPKNYELQFVNSLFELLKPGGFCIFVTSEDPFGLLTTTISQVTGYPRGYNLRMNYSFYLKKIMLKKFTLYQEKSLRHQVFIFQNRGLVFVKKN